MEQDARPSSPVRRVAGWAGVLIAGVALAEATTGFSSGLGLDIRKHAESFGSWLGSSADAEEGAAKAKAEREKCQADYLKAVAQAGFEYREAHNIWANCVKWIGLFEDSEVKCRSEKTVRSALKARLDAVKQFSCSG